VSYYNKIFNIAYINLLLVIFSYFIRLRYGTDYLSFLKIIRILCLIYSFYTLNNIVSFRSIKDNYSSKNLFIVFIVLIFISSISAKYPISVLTKVLTFIPSIIFTIIFINTSFFKLGLNTTKILLLRLSIKSFSIPLISSIFLNGNYYLGKNLYGMMNTLTMGDNILYKGFMSNHLAWCGIIVFSSSFAYLEMTQLTKSKKLILYILMLFSITTIINSGSRTILVGLIFYLIVLFLKKFSFSLKFIKTVFLICFFTFWINKIDLTQFDSVKFLIERTSLHLYNQENLSRFSFLQSGFEIFKRYPSKIISGIGMFNRQAISDESLFFFSTITGVKTIANFHNSYADILFGGGIIVFFIFVYLALYKSLRQLWIYDDKYFYLVVPLHLIAFTESSLQGGQFIFYPLFYFICVSNLKCLNVSSRIKPI
jgi:O-antigen ligase